MRVDFAFRAFVADFVLTAVLTARAIFMDSTLPDHHKYFTKHLPLKQAQPIMYPIIPRTHFIVRLSVSIEKLLSKCVFCGFVKAIALFCKQQFKTLAMTSAVRTKINSHVGLGDRGVCCHCKIRNSRPWHLYPHSFTWHCVGHPFADSRSGKTTLAHLF